ncbi:hypothetical protein GCM10023221_32500 [Luteimicrobium xylanilyticum]
MTSRPGAGAQVGHHRDEVGTHADEVRDARHGEHDADAPAEREREDLTPGAAGADRDPPGHGGDDDECDERFHDSPDLDSVKIVGHASVR